MRRLEPVALVGGIPGGDLGPDQGAQHFLGVQGRVFATEHFGCGAAHRGFLQRRNPPSNRQAGRYRRVQPVLYLLWWSCAAPVTGAVIL